MSSAQIAQQKRHAVPAIALAMALIASCVMAGEDPDPDELSKLVRQDCGSCHGLTLNGGLGRPLTSDRLMQWDRDQLTQIILDGIPGTPMPSWRPLLTQAQARWIAEALKSGSVR